MERAQTGSLWWPYIGNLPQRFNVPVFFSGDEISSLQYVPVLHQVKKRCKFLIELARVVEIALQKLSAEQHPFRGQQVGASSLGWAMAAVSSRAFCMHMPEDFSQELPSQRRVMLPLIDMCNHSFCPNARIVQQKNGTDVSFLVVAENDLQAGSYILLSYGALSNDMLLLDYGFVVHKNPYDYVEVRYDNSLLDAASAAANLSCASLLHQAPWQETVLEHLNLEGAGASPQVRVGGSDLVDGRLLAALRVLYSQDANIVLNKDLNMLQSWGPVPPLGNKIESQVLKSLVAVCALSLGQFSSTIKEDENILTNKELTPAMRLAVEYRMSKKQSLVDAMRGFTRKLKSFM